MPQSIELHGRGTGLAPQCIQEVLESASNAGAIGQSAFFTPLPFGKLCARPLARDRAVVVDLTAGNGALAIAASTPDTEAILLSDIENVRTRYEDGWPRPKNHRIAGDLGGLFPLFKEIEFQADCIVLNPPFSLKWKKSAFAKLAESELETVRRAFTEYPEDTIDSTVMTLMAALDLCSYKGEGFLIANDDTLSRLIFNESAPFRLLETHVWARAILTGNPMTGEKMQTWDKTKEFHTGIIWFAWSHDQGLAPGATLRAERIENVECGMQNGPGSTGAPPAPSGAPPAAPPFGVTPSGGPGNDRGVSVTFASAVEHFALARSRLRAGSEIWGRATRTEGQDDLSRAVRAEGEIRQGKKPAEFNIWLNALGVIETYLSIFDARNTVKIPKEEAKSLFQLNGKKPMQLVMQRAERQLLLHHCNGSLWRVDPRLKQAVEDALAEYYAIRAPLMPLNEIQSLGFVDEADLLECKADLEGIVNSELGMEKENQRAKGAKFKIQNSKFKIQRSVLFHAGKSYHVRTQTVTVSRTVNKPGMDGQLHEHFLKGQELAIFIKDDTGAERCFMDKRLSELAAKVEGDKEQDNGHGYKYTITAEISPDFDLETLVHTFTIPTAADVAKCQPERYRAMLASLDTIEAIVNAKG